MVYSPRRRQRQSLFGIRQEIDALEGEHEEEDRTAPAYIEKVSDMSLSVCVCKHILFEG